MSVACWVIQAEQGMSQMGVTANVCLASVGDAMGETILWLIEPPSCCSL